MPRKKSPTTLSTKQMKRSKLINTSLMRNIEPLTENQEKLWEEYAKGQNLIAYGASSTGKTFCLVYNALKEVLSEDSPYEKVYLVRSLVATREIEARWNTRRQIIPLSDSLQEYGKTYVSMYTDKEFETLYDDLQRQETIEKLWSTSFLRGTTLDNAIVIVDEFQNLNFHELDSIITRVGENSKIMFAGDATQTDLRRSQNALAF